MVGVRPNQNMSIGCQYLQVAATRCRRKNPQHGTVDPSVLSRAMKNETFPNLDGISLREINLLGRVVGMDSGRMNGRKWRSILVGTHAFYRRTCGG